MPSPRQYTYNSNHIQATRLVWISVACIAGAIFALWGWSLKQRLSWFKWAETPEGQVAAQTKTDWDKIFAEEKAEQEEKDAVKKQLETVVSELINQSK